MGEADGYLDAAMIPGREVCGVVSIHLPPVTTTMNVNRTKIKIDQDARQDVVYYRHAEPDLNDSCPTALEGVNWLELARQKQALLGVIWNDPDHPLWGLVSLIDHLQDVGDAQGYPVVWAGCLSEWEG